MTDQLELSLEWRLLDVENCPHKVLVVNGVQEDGEGGSFPLVTCYHPSKPYCGGTFDARKFNRNGVVVYDGLRYSLDFLNEW